MVANIEQSRNRRHKALSPKFCAKFAKMMEELNYEEIIHRLREECQKLVKESEALDRMSSDLTQQHNNLDQNFLQMCQKWQPAYPTESIMNSAIAERYREQKDKLSEQECQLNAQIHQLTAHIRLVSDALDLCDDINKRHSQVS